jgi:hypothetical protein
MAMYGVDFEESTLGQDLGSVVERLTNQLSEH